MVFAFALSISAHLAISTIPVAQIRTQYAADAGTILQIDFRAPAWPAAKSGSAIAKLDTAKTALDSSSLALYSEEQFESAVLRSTLPGRLVVARTPADQTSRSVVDAETGTQIIDKYADGLSPILDEPEVIAWLARLLQPAARPDPEPVVVMPRKLFGMIPVTLGGLGRPPPQADAGALRPMLGPALQPLFTTNPPAQSASTLPQCEQSAEILPEVTSIDCAR